MVASNELYFKSQDNMITVNGQQYNGLVAIKLVPKEKKLYLLNKLGLENYVYSVLRAESYQSWPHDMQKIQAIVSRTYAVHQMLVQKKRKNPFPYDIKRSNFHQRYPGNHKYHHLWDAVNQTKGTILTHNDYVVLAMFDACCGGSIPANMTGIDFDKAPYLARKEPCQFCKNYGLYQWKRRLSTKDLLTKLAAKGLVSKKHRITGLKITDRDKAGIVHRIEIQQGKRRTTITGKDLWASMNNIVRSQNFTLKKVNNTIEINGRGFGHQMGLCQRGARELVRNNWDLRNILSFYYPNTKLAKLRVRRKGCHHTRDM